MGLVALPVVRVLPPVLLSAPMTNIGNALLLLYQVRLGFCCCTVRFALYCTVPGYYVLCMSTGSAPPRLYFASFVGWFYE
jgi:hypothetical protein